MKHILDNKPTGCISGIEDSPGGDIIWSKTLPESCRLSTDLKQRLELLLRRLLESNRNKLMTFKEFFNETDRIFHLIPIYYLNLQRFNLTCNYFEANQPITDLYDHLKQQNRDRNDEQYYCLFQKYDDHRVFSIDLCLSSSVPYPVSTRIPMSVKQFFEQLPIPTSHANPLVFYTFSPINDREALPKLHIPSIRGIRQFNDVAAACEWSKDEVGLFFYIKAQLMDYQHILQTAQCSTTIMKQHLKSNLLEFLCTIREKLIVFRAIEELKNILDQIDTNNPPSHSSSSSGNVSMTSVTGHTPSGRSLSTSGEAPGIGFSHLLSNNSSSNENSLSPGRQCLISLDE